MRAADIAHVLTDRKKKVLLMLDGHDEYTPGTNTDIDSAISKGSLVGCCVLVTSRDRKELNEIRPYMDIEAEIIGFDPNKVEEYIKRYLKSDKECKKLIQMAKNSKLITKRDFGLLQKPIFLHMICVLYQRNVSLPKSMTGVISAVVERCPDWEEIRRSGQKTDAEMKAALELALLRLGKLCWERIKQGNKDIIFTQVTGFLAAMSTCFRSPFKMFMTSVLSFDFPKTWPKQFCDISG